MFKQEKKIFNNIFTECSIEVGGKVVRQDTCKLSQETKDMIKKRQSMKASKPKARMELAQLSKLINKHKVADIRYYNAEIIEQAIKNGGILKAVKRKLGMGKNQMYALRDKEGNVTRNMDKIIKVVEHSTDIYTVAGSFGIIMEGELSRLI